jgi:hypothetical protein
MPLQIGIVGLPNVGKSTLFNAITNKQVDASNFPFCTIDPNVGVVKVPDARLEKLAAVSKPKKIVPATIEFVDIAGLVKGASEGEGLGNKFLHNIRECDAICEVVRDFNDHNIIHVHGVIDPESDRETINTELIMADLQTVEKGLARAEREAKSGSKETLKLKNLLARLKQHLDAVNPARTLDIEDDEKPLIKSLHLLTMKPIIYVLNRNDNSKNDKKSAWDGEVVELNIKQEQEIAALPEEEQKEFIIELGLEESGLDKLIRSAYRLLDLISFFTTGPEETRAWTIRNGAKAPEAAGAIHSDFEKGFIRAETIAWDKFVAAGSEASAREKGLIRTEGKEYVMQDGDVCHFLHN